MFDHIKNWRSPNFSQVRTFLERLPANDDRRLLAFPLLLYVSLCVLYLFAVPVGESPDEPGHLQCIEQVSLQQRLPTVDPKPVGEWWERSTLISGKMCYHMPLYYLVAGTTQRLIAAVSGTAVPDYVFPPSNQLPSPYPGMFLHPPKTSFWQLSEPAALLGLRILSIGLGLITVAGSFVIANTLFPEQRFAGLLAATLVAGWPQFVFMGRAINNDALATAVAVLILVTLLTRVGQPRRYLWAGGLVVIALFTKLSILFTIVAVGGSWLIELIYYWRKRRLYFMVVAANIGLWSGALSLILAHPVLSVHFQRGSVAPALIPERAQQSAYWLDVFVTSLSSGWARFGWMNVPAPEWHVYLWWASIALAAAAGLYRFRKRQTTIRQWQMWCMVIWIAGVMVSYIRVNITVFQPQFRFAWSLLPLLAAFAAAGWLNMSKRWQAGSIALTTAFLILYNAWLIQMIDGVYYA